MLACMHTTLWPLYRSTCVRWHPVKTWRILMDQCFTAHMPLLTATRAFRLGRRHYRVLLNDVTASSPYHTVHN